MSRNRNVICGSCFSGDCDVSSSSQLPSAPDSQQLVHSSSPSARPPSDVRRDHLEIGPQSRLCPAPITSLATGIKSNVITMIGTPSTCQTHLRRSFFSSHPKMSASDLKSPPLCYSGLVLMYLVLLPVKLCSSQFQVTLTLLSLLSLSVNITLSRIPSSLAPHIRLGTDSNLFILPLECKFCAGRDHHAHHHVLSI